MAKKTKNGVIIIKKYANRRLYDTQTSSYIILEDLFNMIKRGEVFEVKDAKTEEDITRSVLTQIIFEQETKGYNLLPISFLRKLIGMYGNSRLENMVPSYLNVSMDNFMKNQEQFVQFSAEDWHEYTPVKIFENIAKQNMEIFENTVNMFAPKEKDD